MQVAHRRSLPCHDVAMRRTLLLTTALALSLTSCSGSEPDVEDAPAASASTPVPEGVETTAPGTELEFGDAATLAWQPTQELAGVLDLTVDSVAEQPRSVFVGWARDDAMAAARPYFVLVSLTNTGDSDLGGQAVPLYLRDDAGSLGAPWTLGGDFTACQSGPLPTPFGPDAEADLCLVYLAPEGARIQDMVFKPTEAYDAISWTGDVGAPTKPRPEKGARKKG